MPERIEVLITGDSALYPAYAKAGDAGADLRSRVNTVVPAGGRVLVPTGVSIALPSGFVGLVHPRSGLATKHGITVLNAPGTVDSGYRGELMVTLQNHSDVDFEVVVGDRIAQLVIQRYVEAVFVPVSELPGSERGASGFGSSGVK